MCVSSGITVFWQTFTQVETVVFVLAAMLSSDVYVSKFLLMLG